MSFEKLSAAGSRLKEKGLLDMNRERVTNTPRRANAAGYAVKKAADDIRVGEICMGIAEFALLNPKREVVHVDVRKGGGKNFESPFRYLSYLGSVSGVRLLLVNFARARRNRCRIESSYLNKSERFNAGDIPFATLPTEGNAWESLETILKPYVSLGLRNDAALQGALGEFLPFLDVGEVRLDPVKEMERSLVGKKLGVDFFPTPAGLANEMVLDAGVSAGSLVLEPSAGSGNLAEAIVSAGGKVHCIEWSSTLSDLLRLKKFEVLGSDFMDFETDLRYDAVVMNPPFSDRKDAAHVMRAFGFLADGGTLVAICGEGVFFGSDSKAVEFREWLDSVGAEVTKLPSGTFMEKRLLATTGANARKVVIRK